MLPLRSRISRVCTRAKDENTPRTDGGYCYVSPSLRTWRALRCIFLLFSVLICGQSTVVALTAAAPHAMTGTTVITSQRLEFDNRERRAVFQDNVVVNDLTMRMRTDNLVVMFDEHENPVSLEADGNVIILQDDRLAVAQSAFYDVIAGKMVLSGSAEVRRGRDILRGDTITFWRDRDLVEVVPGTLVLSPGERRP